MALCDGKLFVRIKFEKYGNVINAERSRIKWKKCRKSGECYSLNVNKTTEGMNQWHIFHVFDKPTVFNHSSSTENWQFLQRIRRKFFFCTEYRQVISALPVWNGEKKKLLLRKYLLYADDFSLPMDDRRNVSIVRWCMDFITLEGWQHNAQRYKSTTTEFRKSLLWKMYPVLWISQWEHDTNKQRIRHIRSELMFWHRK